MPRRVIAASKVFLILRETNWKWKFSMLLQSLNYPSSRNCPCALATFFALNGFLPHAARFIGSVDLGPGQALTIVVRLPSSPRPFVPSPSLCLLLLLFFFSLLSSAPFSTEQTLDAPALVDPNASGCLLQTMAFLMLRSSSGSTSSFPCLSFIYPAVKLVTVAFTSLRRPKYPFRNLYSRCSPLGESAEQPRLCPALGDPRGKVQDLQAIVETFFIFPRPFYKIEVHRVIRCVCSWKRTNFRLLEFDQFIEEM